MIDFDYCGARKHTKDREKFSRALSIKKACPYGKNYLHQIDLTEHLLKLKWLNRLKELSLQYCLKYQMGLACFSEMSCAAK